MDGQEVIVLSQYPSHKNGVCQHQLHMECTVKESLSLLEQEKLSSAAMCTIFLVISQRDVQ